MTGSHNPAEYNGGKLYLQRKPVASGDIERVREIALSGKFTQGSGHKLQRDVASDYLDELVGDVAIAMPLKIVVDAGNGAGGFFAKDVLEPLGADVSGSQFLEPDGMFPNHVPNPEDADAMRSIQRAVSESNADLGVIFDTDVDRSAVVDSKGMAFNKNRLIAAMSAITLRDSPGGTVVTDSVTSDALTDFIESRGGRHLRFKRGYKNVIEKGKEIDNCPLMIETSGRGASRRRSASRRRWRAAPVVPRPWCRP